MDVHGVDHWATSSINFVTALGLFNGTSATTFSPEELTTRGQLMTVLARLAGKDTTGGDPIKNGIMWAVLNGISDGSEPYANITRQDVAVMLWRFAGEPKSTYDISEMIDYKNIFEYAETAVAWAIESGILTGYPDSTLQPTANATRAHVATMIARFVKYIV